MGRSYGSVRVRFEYDVVPQKRADMEAGGDFDHCASFDDLMDELRDQAPTVEWSVHPNEDDARKLWEMIQSQRAI